MLSYANHLLPPVLIQGREQTSPEQAQTFGFNERTHSLTDCPQCWFTFQFHPLVAANFSFSHDGREHIRQKDCSSPHWTWATSTAKTRETFERTETLLRESVSTLISRALQLNQRSYNSGGVLLLLRRRGGIPWPFPSWRSRWGNCQWRGGTPAPRQMTCSCSAVCTFWSSG